MSLTPSPRTAPDRRTDRPPAIGIGLNKTGTKSLRYCLRSWGYRHRTYDIDAFRLFEAGRLPELLETMESYDSFEDWPWPLMYREIDAHFPDARFILTVRKDAETWYRSLCNMAVRMGPFTGAEVPVYGWAMPQGHRDEHVAVYERHNAEVRAHFADRPGKLLELCWEVDRSTEALAAFLGEEPLADVPHYNRSPRVYSGDIRWLAELNRRVFKPTDWVHRRLRRVARRLLRAHRREPIR